MSRTGRSLLCPALFIFAIASSAAGVAQAATPITVTYAGSMGAVMDKALGPAFDKAQGTDFHGIGQGSYGLAHLLAAKQQRADVFVAITPGPMKILQKAGLVDKAVPIASTQMVIAYSPKSRFAKQFEEAKAGDKAWYKVLETPGLRFGRTDPRTDPQGRNIVFTMKLAERYYHQQGLVDKILGPIMNQQQIFTEPSLLSRLGSGQIDASSSYLSAAISHHLPYIKLPDEINLSNPAMMQQWYSHAQFETRLTTGKMDTLSVQPLVFYAAVLKNAAHPKLGAAFVEFLQSARGQAMLKKFGYSRPKGGSI